MTEEKEFKDESMITWFEIKIFLILVSGFIGAFFTALWLLIDVFQLI